MFDTGRSLGMMDEFYAEHQRNHFANSNFVPIRKRKILSRPVCDHDHPFFHVGIHDGFQ